MADPVLKHNFDSIQNHIRANLSSIPFFFLMHQRLCPINYQRGTRLFTEGVLIYKLVKQVKKLHLQEHSKTFFIFR